MAVLERALGIKILERNRRGAALTDFGRLLASHAAALDSVIARASEEVELKKLGMDGSLAIGASPVACVDVIPDVISQLKKKAPNIAIRINELPDDELIESLRSGEIDFMISPTGLMPDQPDIKREVLLRDGFTGLLRARAASGQATVAPPSADMNCRLAMSIAMRPSGGGRAPVMGIKLARFGGGLCEVGLAFAGHRFWTIRARILNVRGITDFGRWGGRAVALLRGGGVC
jgi:DNA-binding transcriptional LysR family regulator